MADGTSRPEKPDWALSGRERADQARAARGLKPRRRRWPWVVLGLVVLGGGALWLRQDRTPAPGAATGTDSPQITLQMLPSELAKVQPAELRDTVKVTGSLAPETQAHLSAEVSGRLASVAVRAGDRVQAGQLLAQIDTETLENTLDQQRANAEATRAQLRLAQTQLERTRSMVKRGVVATSELDSDQASVDQLAASLKALEAQVESAEESIAKARIAAPFSGMISERDVDPGAYVATGTELFSIVDLTRMEFEADVPVRYAPGIHAGQRVELTVEGLGDAAFTGVVDRVNPVAASGTRMLPVYVGLDNPDTQLRGGMFASGLLVMETKADALGVPSEAIRQDPEGTYVLKVVDGVATRQAVQTARTWEGGRVTEVSSGLAAGDIIVAQPLEGLRAGAAIHVIAEPQTE
ncbi:efflux RND transporter periplasmic adaptor subunit [Pseudooceanicola sp. CBS1P-1]|uniref:Efflux RND transporter periplasmic adaptor subunit n=1 Tax=Pseudooceanicola albus TaxID=2692189 RepID=A0A6L7G2A8_9RHOB|nr:MULTISPECIES: efflux RND transporter periplasmic adaptor subunit [Pseudooceanicola]MBT9384966.1 efflux RND transporter periplasmic adaptor subunit [Pseudooceanicola endophyticus]MXN18039.1 efflux RND transporter periplasmic adaptor subunit [Pseudooceanicola albus]